MSEAQGAPPPHPSPSPRPGAPGWEGRKGGSLGGFGVGALPGKRKEWGPRSAPSCWMLGFGREQSSWGLCAATPGLPTWVPAAVCVLGVLDARMLQLALDSREAAGRDLLSACLAPGLAQDDSSVICLSHLSFSVHRSVFLYLYGPPGSVSLFSLQSYHLYFVSVASWFFCLPSELFLESVRISESSLLVSALAALGSS